jgi:hypothetical protein
MDFSITFPLQKINKQQRIVTGIATANNVDLEGDLIDFDASVRAFSNWIGNIREMHHPKAVGKLVDWRPTKVMHMGKMYDAIEVDVYISKGAEDTWQKILDGTLRGFSIGGRALEKQNVFDPEIGTHVTKVTEYMLGELSVVDNPCNPAGLFMLIKKAPDGSLVSAYDDGEDKGVFYCSDHQYATIDSSVCPSCATEMKKIGVVKEFDAEVINKMIEGYDLELKGGTSNTMDLQEKNKDGNVSTMDVELTEEQQQGILAKLGKALFSKSEEQTVSDVVVPNITINIEKSVIADDVAEEDSTEEDVVEKSADFDTDETIEDSDKEEEMDLEKVLEGVGALLDEKLTKVKEEISAEVDEKISDISKSVDDFKEQTEAEISSTKDELEKVANTGAEKKSVDVDEIDEEDGTLEKSAPKESFWGGIFVPQEFIEVLGYES